MKQGDLHSFPEAVESFGSEGKLSTITGGDGIVRKKNLKFRDPIKVRMEYLNI